MDCRQSRSYSQTTATGNLRKRHSKLPADQFSNSPWTRLLVSWWLTGEAAAQAQASNVFDVHTPFFVE
jgi:hypothetical protein